MSLSRTLRFAVLAACGLLAAGCATRPGALEHLLAEEVPPLTPVNHRGDGRLATDLRRVAVLPLYGGTVAAPESTEVLDAVLVEALQRQMRFEVVMVSRAECRRLFGAPEYSSVEALPHGFLDQLATHYAVEAVLFTDLTVYRPHQPLAVGLRAKLADVRDMHLIWACDEVFTAADPRMQASVRRAARTGARGSLTDPAPAILQSPSRFGTVVAGLVFGTLPPR